MAEDEGCFGRLSIPRRAWAPPGMRPHAPQQLIREYTYVYAAVAPAEGKMTSLILPSADTEMMNLFLEHVSKTYEKYFVVMQVDQASWHGAKDLRIPANIRLIAQPAYSPELNPVEHIWKELREKQLANLALLSLDEVIDKVCDGLNQLEADTERLRSLTYFPHFRMVSYNTPWKNCGIVKSTPIIASPAMAARITPQVKEAEWKSARSNIGRPPGRRLSQRSHRKIRSTLLDLRS